MLRGREVEANEEGRWAPAQRRREKPGDEGSSCKGNVTINSPTCGSKGGMTKILGARGDGCK
jgi:hypothetical protein